jgi:hypothetical protein
VKRKVVLDLDGRMRDAKRDPARLEWEVGMARSTLESSAARSRELSALIALEVPWSDRWWNLLKRLDKAHGQYLFEGGDTALEALRLWRSQHESGSSASGMRIPKRFGQP